MVHICHHRKSAHKVAEFLTFGVGISSTYAAGPGRIHLSSLRCLTVHFSARIFDLERYESRWSEEKERGRGVALIHSTVSASLSALPRARGDFLLLRLRRSTKISLVSSFPTFHSWSALLHRELDRNSAIFVLQHSNAACPFILAELFG